MQVEYRILTTSGEKTVREIGYSEKDASGKVVRLFGTAQDITERKRTEERLKQSESKYRALTEMMNDVVWTTDMDFNFTYISPSLHNLVGDTPEEYAQGSPRKMITRESLVKAVDLLDTEQRYEHEKGINPERTVTFETEVIHKNGPLVWVESIVGAVRGEDGTFIGLHGVSRDITQRKRTALKMEYLNARLNQALAEVKTLSGLLPICSSCKRIQDGNGHWNNIESYITSHSDVFFSHGICPECLKKKESDCGR